MSCLAKVEIVEEEREVSFLSSSKNSGNLNFSTVHSGKNSIFWNFCWMIRTQVGVDILSELLMSRVKKYLVN